MSTMICPKTVGEISDVFFIKDYQRGYRWTKTQVKRLLSDIWERIGTNDKYFLQPVVVVKHNEGYELIDGQQRLTTLYLALSYADMVNMGKEPEDYCSRVSFKLKYETRPKSAEFLAKLGYGFVPEDNIDFYYMHQALGAIQEWFAESLQNNLASIKKFDGSVADTSTILWYEIDTKNTSTTPEDVFIRLNSGKIPLTNAELLRAWFLSGEKGQDENETELKTRCLTIGLQWDDMEHELADKSFWAFITNNPQEDYATKIDLIMEMAAWDKDSKFSKNEDDYAVFYALLKQHTEEEKCKFPLWKKIQLDYQRMRHWYDDKELYHKVGYLITSEHRTMPEILWEAQSKGAEDFKKYIDDSIKESLKNVVSLKDIEYKSNYKLAERILLLFNIISLLGNAEDIGDIFLSMDRYPFAVHKKNAWSLEHVLAQNDAGLTTKVQWNSWIDDHRKIFVDVEKYCPKDDDGKVDSSVIHELALQFGEVANRLIEWDNISSSDEEKRGDKFKEIASEVARFFEILQKTGDIHELGNLALLTVGANSILSNDVFEVKRRKIIDIDKKGKFIPLCTKRLFMRYYSNNKINVNLPYWSPQDREGYLKAIEETLGNYLTLNQEEEKDNA